MGALGVVISAKGFVDTRCPVRTGSTLKCAVVLGIVSSQNALGLDLMDVCACTHMCICAEMDFIFNDGSFSRTAFLR